MGGNFKKRGLVLGESAPSAPSALDVTIVENIGLGIEGAVPEKRCFRPLFFGGVTSGVCCGE